MLVIEIENKKIFKKEIKGAKKRIIWKNENGKKQWEVIV